MKRHKFVCDKCKSVFIADVGEYQLLDKNGDPANDVYVYARQIACQCPVCLHYVCEDLNKKKKKKKKHKKLKKLLLSSINIKGPIIRATLFGLGFILSVVLGGFILMTFDSHASGVLGIGLLFTAVVCAVYFMDSMEDI